MLILGCDYHLHYDNTVFPEHWKFSIIYSISRTLEVQYYTVFTQKIPRHRFCNLSERDQRHVRFCNRLHGLCLAYCPQPNRYRRLWYNHDDIPTVMSCLREEFDLVLY